MIQWEHTDHKKALFFNAKIYPNQSFSKKQQARVMRWTAGLTTVFGAAFFLVGAWPVIGFMGLDVLILYAAFHAYNNKAACYEHVTLDHECLKVKLCDAMHRPSRTYRIDPSFLFVQLDDASYSAGVLQARKHQQIIAFGSYLGLDEKRELQQRLAHALRERMKALPHLSKAQQLGL